MVEWAHQKDEVSLIRLLKRWLSESIARVKIG